MQRHHGKTIMVTGQYSRRQYQVYDIPIQYVAYHYVPPAFTWVYD